ncbi:hypothetical protein GIB67_032728, partial [Kingdonia uniflora]
VDYTVLYESQFLMELQSHSCLTTTEASYLTIGTIKPPLNKQQDFLQYPFNGLESLRELQGGKKLEQTLSFENQNTVLDSVPTFFGLWGNTRINQQVVADHAEKSTRAKTCARERAKEVQQSLDPEYPSFVKSMVRSTCLPAQFCDLYLPKNDVMVTLVDEKDEECQVKFKSGGFSVGWTGFSTAHNLVDGDALVFQLVKDVKFQAISRMPTSTSEPIYGFVHETYVCEKALKEEYLHDASQAEGFVNETEKVHLEQLNYLKEVLNKVTEADMPTEV